MGARSRACSIRRLKDFELIVVDDGSTDASVTVAKSFADPRIKIIELGENRGGNAARNAGVRAAKAPLIAFLDSDDTYLPEKLETVAAEFDRRPDLDLLVDSFVKIQPSGARVTRRNPVIDDRETFRKALFQRQLWKATPVDHGEARGGPPRVCSTRPSSACRTSTS